MIITRYLVKEISRNQIAILFVLLLIFFCQKLLKIFSTVIDGEIPINLMFSLIGLSMPEITQLVLPLSLFLGLLITFNKLHANGEIIAMYSCGLGRFTMVKVAMILAFATGIVSTISVIWITPLSSRYQEKILVEAKNNTNIETLMQGKFQKNPNRNSVFFIKNVNGNRFRDIFFAQLYPTEHFRSSIIIADSGQFFRSKDGYQIVALQKGMYFESTAALHDFYITDFQNYQIVIEYHKMPSDCSISDTDKMNIRTLWHINTNRARAELHWRITLILTVFMMALMVIPLDIINSYNKNILSIMQAMLLYLIFFLLQTSIKSNAEKGQINPMLWTWGINVTYLLLVMILNLWDTVFVRYIRTYFIQLHFRKEIT